VAQAAVAGHNSAVEDFIGRLSDALVHHRPLRVLDDGARRAAVAVVLAATPETSILFVRRQERAGDPWSGQMAFPGGFASDSDSGIERTAKREALEETGLDLSQTQPLGLLDDLHPRTVYLPPIIVTPVLFTLRDARTVTPGPEVQEAVWLPVRLLLAPESRQPYDYHGPAGDLVFDSLVVDGYTIWGLTERILTQLFSTAGYL
jgi:8-oxo-dGTP pyrophosphatase MutT (NUDIX family)